jgi:hypothetical protein
MEGFYVLVGGMALFAIALTAYFVIQDRKEEKKRKAH